MHWCMETGRPTGGIERNAHNVSARTDQLARISGVLVPATLAGLGALHAAWALGWRWPGGSDTELAERVVGAGAELPPAWATWAVAAALGGAAAIVRSAWTDEPSPLTRRLTWAVAVVFLVRGAVYIPIDLIRGLDATYDRLDIAIYSPLCLGLGAGALAVARSASSTRPAQRLARPTAGAS